MQISKLGVTNDALQQLAQQSGPANKSNGTDFSKTLMDVIKQVDGTQKDAMHAQQSLVTGQSVDYHDMMIAMEKASTAMQLTLSVRNKILEAYQEINRMPV